MPYMTRGGKGWTTGTGCRRVKYVGMTVSSPVLDEAVMKVTRRDSALQAPLPLSQLRPQAPYEERF